MRGLLVAALLAAIFAANALAQSQQPSPGPAKPRQTPQSQGAPGNKPAAPDQRGTDNSPFVVKVIPTQEDKGKAAQDRDEQQNKTTTDYWTMVGVNLTAGFTFLLFVAVSVQAVLFLWQLRLMRQGVADAKTAADAAAKSAEIAELAFMASDRPYLVIAMRPFLVRDGVGPFTPHVDFSIGNEGKTGAQLMHRSIELVLFSDQAGVPLTPKYGRIERVFTHITDKPLGVRRELVREDGKLAVEVGPGAVVIAFGYLEYGDRTGFHYFTGFGQQFEWRSGVFVPLDSAAYNYRKRKPYNEADYKEY